MLYKLFSCCYSTAIIIPLISKSSAYKLYPLFEIIAEPCPELESPQNGTVTVEELLYPNEATYECSDGFNLVGNATSKCQISGEWTEEAPTCEEEPTEVPSMTPTPTTEDGTINAN